MRRAALLIACAAVLASAACASAATTTAPRGELSAAEYREFVALQRDEKQRSSSHNLNVIARHTCRALTDISRLMTAQHTECEASLIYSYEFAAFPYAIADCAKLSTTAQQTRCDLTATTSFHSAVGAFITTNAASTRAADPRHLAQRCLSYLLFTKKQARATNRLLAGLKHYATALKGGSSTAIATADTRVNSDLVASRQAMSLDITVSVCKHQ